MAKLFMQLLNTKQRRLYSLVIRRRGSSRHENTRQTRRPGGDKRADRR